MTDETLDTAIDAALAETDEATLDRVVEALVGGSFMTAAQKKITDALTELAENFTYDVTEQLHDRLNQYAAERAEKIVHAMLTGNEEALRDYLRLGKFQYDGREYAGRYLSQTTPIALRERIFTANAEWLKDERVADLEATIEGLTKRCAEEKERADRAYNSRFYALHSRRRPRTFDRCRPAPNKGSKHVTDNHRTYEGPIVWFVQEPSAARADLSSAQRYGKVVFMLSKRDNPSLTPGPCLTKLLKALDGYRDGDFVAAAIGDQAGILLAGIALERLRLTRGELTWLRWERERAPNGDRLAGAGFYVPSTLTRD